MEHNESQQQEPVGLDASAEVPATLLPGVLARLERRRVYQTIGQPLPQLIAALNHGRWEIRSAAVYALGQMGDQAPLDALLTALHDDHYLVRVAALRAVGQAGARIPLEQVLGALHDPEREVREMAIEVLSELSGHTTAPLHALAQSVAQDSHYQGLAAAVHVQNMDSSSSATQMATLPVPIERKRTQRSFLRSVGRYWLVLSKQVPLLHRSIWGYAPIMLLIWGALSPFISAANANGTRTAILFLVLLMTTATAASTAFIYGGEHDASFELMLSTPISLRVIMLCRFVLVVGYNTLLTAGVSAALALAQGGSLWEIMQLWLGPMILLSSLTLTISLLLGTGIALFMACIIEASQTIALHMDKHWPAFDLVLSSNWQTSPGILLLALLLLACATFYAPRQPHLSIISH